VAPKVKGAAAILLPPLEEEEDIITRSPLVVAPKVKAVAVNEDAAVLDASAVAKAVPKVNPPIEEAEVGPGFVAGVLPPNVNPALLVPTLVVAEAGAAAFWFVEEVAAAGIFSAAVVVVIVVVVVEAAPPKEKPLVPILASALVLVAGLASSEQLFASIF